MALLNRHLPVGELADVRVAGLLVQLAENRPMTDLARLRHRQELESVERVGLVVEIGRHHFRRLALDRPSLFEDGGLLALEAAGHVRAALSSASPASLAIRCRVWTRSS